MDQGITLVTNACALDAPRLRLTLPHWLRGFGDQLAAVKVAVDTQPPEGRIATVSEPPKC